MNEQPTQPAPDSLEAEALKLQAAIPAMLRSQLAPSAAFLIRLAREIDTLKGKP